MADSIGAQMGNINGERFRMNYINVNHLVQLYDDVSQYKHTRNTIDAPKKRKRGVVYFRSKSRFFW